MSIWSPDELYDRPRRGRGCGCLLSLLLVAALGGGGAWWLGSASPWAEALQTRWAASPVGGWVDRVWSLGFSRQRLAQLAPPDTRVYAEIAPSWWGRLWHRGLGWQPRDNASLQELRAWVREQWGLEWDTDVAPWFEPEVGLLGRATAGAEVDQWSSWVATRDRSRAEACLHKVRELRAGAGDAVSEGHHGSTRYDVIRPREGAPYALGLVGDYVVMATPPEAIAPLIDQLEQGGPSLASANPRYRRMAGAWERGAIGHVFCDVAGPAGPRPTAGGLPPIEAVGGEISGGSEWISLALTTAFDMTEVPPASRDRWRELMPALDLSRFDRLPDTTVVALGATATPQTREWLAGPLAAVLAPLGGGLWEGWAFTGLLSSLGAMQGPFAFGLLAAPPEAAAPDPVGAVLSLRPDAPEALEAGLNRQALTVAGAQAPALGPWWPQGLLPKAAELVEETHRGETWKVLRAGGQNLAGWTRSGPELVVAGGGEALRLSQADRFRAIRRAPGFEAVLRHGRGPAGIVFYADGPNLVHLLQSSLVPAKYAAQAGRALTPLRALGGTLGPGIDGQGFHHAQLTVVVAP